MEEEKELDKITVQYSQTVAVVLNVLKSYCSSLSEEGEFEISGFDFKNTDVFVHGIVVLSDLRSNNIRILAVHSSPMTFIIEDESDLSVEQAVNKQNKNYNLSLSVDKIKYNLRGVTNK